MGNIADYNKSFSIQSLSEKHGQQTADTTSQQEDNFFTFIGIGKSMHTIKEKKQYQEREQLLCIWNQFPINSANQLKQSTDFLIKTNIK